MNRNNMEAKEEYVTKEHHIVDEGNTIIVKKETLWEKFKKKVRSLVKDK